jgi:anti-sigma factor RsiW
MNHPHEDQLLLLAYDELPAADAAGLEAHLATCAVCRDDLARLERARVALDWAEPKPRRSARWIVAALAAAAAAVAALMFTNAPPRDRPRGWPAPREWSATAGYIAGGQPLITIDAQLTRLEQERSYARP